MNIELESARSVQRLRATLNKVKQDILARLSTIPDVESEQYRWLRQHLAEIDRILSGRRIGGRIENPPLPEALKKEIPIEPVFRDALSEASAEIGVGVALIDKKALESLEDYSLELITKISDTLRSDIRSQLRLGIIQGSSVSSITAALSRQHSIIANRAERIARTELARAQAEGHRSGYEQLGVTRLQIIGRGYDCPICSQHIGKIFRIDSCPRIPLHPNCRCDYIPVERGEGNWVVTNRLLQFVSQTSLPSGIIIPETTLKKLGSEHPEPLFVWQSVPTVLTQGATSQPSGPGGPTIYTLTRSKPFLAGFRKFTITVQNKFIIDARLERL
ncbi:MAG: phage head morphogenesis protein [candidate division WOR-3 bacterium]|nr:phage head morphogenesis protein [candidate division WOR-3 bacterium]